MAVTLLDQLTAGAALTMPQLAADIMGGVVTPTVLENGLQVTVPFTPGEVPDPTGQYVWSEALASPDVLALFGLDASQGQRYVLVKVFAVPQDIQSPDDAAALPAGQWPLPECYRSEAYDGSGVKLQAWLLGSPSAPWEAACSSGSNCFTTDWETGATIPAPIGVTLQAGQWSGSGCIRKPRKEWAGISSWPDNAPLK